ncbi:MAG: 5-(carboxyamino)imidazole ribonucleotide mutase [Chloroflexi bacterium]|nr:5-(carboxyamino)imidazole ribonucleotide mutase [Chloroflexota bacterium]
MQTPLVAVVMGSHSDWEIMQHSVSTLTELGVPHMTQVVSAHRTPDLLFSFAESAATRGFRVIIAGAGGAAHLPGMLAAKTLVPVLGVPVPNGAMNGVDAVWSILQMPAGVPVGTLAIGKPGAINAALLAAAIVAPELPEVALALHTRRTQQAAKVLNHPDPRHPGT